jgi:mono/diheme cytochrome c family protein
MTRILAALRHRLAHRLGSNVARVVTWLSRDGRLLTATICIECHQVQGMVDVFPARVEQEPR